MFQNEENTLFTPRAVMRLKFAMLMVLTLFSTSCKKLIEIEAPPTTINRDNVFSNDATAIQVVTAFYTNLSSGNMANDINTVGGIYFSSMLYADEATLFATNNSALSQYYINNVPRNANTSWLPLFRNIALANDAIEGINSSSTLSQKVKQQLLGEVKFYRAFNYFYLVNLYGRVPMPLSTDVDQNRSLARSSEADVYKQIVTDLQDAKLLLSPEYLGATLTGATSERIRPNRAAATALLARIYLYTGDYPNTEIQANEVISNSKYSLNALNAVFLKNSTETIWSLQPVRNDSNNGYNTGEGKLFNLPGTGPNNSNYPVYASNSLVASFENGDARKTNWIGSVTTSGGITFNYPSKYKAGVSQASVTEYEVVLRLGEQYLIRAEARARQGGLKIQDAISDLNVIRTRARGPVTISVPNPLPSLGSSLTQLQVLTAIEHERQTELFTEWGHRWFDLKRTPGFNNPSVTRADELMPAITASKGGTWQAYKKLLPIPTSEIDKDPNLTQNEGY